MRIGIMGGTFNPIHNAHLLIGSLAREQFRLDKVIYMTGGNTPHKDTDGADAMQRFEMVKMAVESNPYFYADDYEVTKSGYSYTVRTLEHFWKKGDELYFILGSDSLDYIDKWYEAEKIFKMCVILVFERKDYHNISDKTAELKGLYGCDIRRIDAPIVEISSSMIRERIKAGKTVRYMLPDNVIGYIKENRLYE